MKSIQLIIVLLIINLLTSNRTFAQSPVELSSNGKVRGSIYDLRALAGDAVLPGGRVIIKGEGIERSIVATDSGEYEFDVPPGTYTITTGQSWFYPIRRASFRVNANSISVINLYPAIRILSIALELGREPVTYAKPPKYDVLSPVQSFPLNLVVEFYNKKVRRGVVGYKRAILSCETLTVSAETINFDEKNLRIEGKGNVLIDNNGQRRRLNNVILNLRNGIPEIISSLDITNYGGPNNSLNRSGNMLPFIRKIGCLVSCLPPG
jgi:hypothetical protein